MYSLLPLWNFVKAADFRSVGHVYVLLLDFVYSGQDAKTGQ